MNQASGSNTIAETVHAASPYYKNGYLGTQLFGDECLKYCPECLTAGYHSYFHQLESLVICPFHGIPLLNRCIHCRASTMRYALDERFDVPMHCSNCDAILSESFSSSIFSKDCQALKISAAFDDLSKGIRVLSDIAWDNREYWGSTVEGDAIHARRTGLFATIIPLIPVQLNKKWFCSEATRKFKMIECHAVPTRARRRFDSKRRGIYQDLVKRFAPNAKDLAYALSDESVKVNHYVETVESDAASKPEILAYALWRNRFEDNLDLRSTLTARARLRKSKIDFPSGWEISDQAWVEFVVSSFEAELSFACRWQGAIRGVSRHDSEWRRLMAGNYQFFSARHQPFAPEMAIFSRSGGHELRKVFICWPSVE